MKREKPERTRQHGLVQNPRLLAWQYLCRWGADKNLFADTLLHSTGADMPAANRALLQAILLGTLRNLRLLEHTLITLRGKSHIQADAYWLLLSALCQLLILQYPEYAVVNESVKIAPRRLRPLINGILRESLRRREAWSAALPGLRPAIRFSVPDRLAERWLSRFGEHEGCALLEFIRQPAPVYLRINSAAPPTSIPPAWEPVAEAPGWYLLPQGAPPADLLQAGRVYIADPATRHSVDLLAPAPGEDVLDICAAPGGKSFGILSASRAACNLSATDSDPARLRILKRNLERACRNVPHAAPVHVQQCDWSRGCPRAFRYAFDAVLADVPCSNTGVLRRRVDVRWRITPEIFAELRARQLSIVRNAMTAVRPGGRLVYSTCSIEPEENGDLVRQLLTEYPGWQLSAERLVLPQREHTDGAYAALLRAPATTN